MEHLDHTSFIDGTIPSTKVLIEQNGLGKDLKKPIKQSDGTLLTPFQQAKRYITESPLSQHLGGKSEEILLENLPTEYYRLVHFGDGETVKLHLDIDDEQDVSTAYPYWWTPPTSNLMYCIPEVGTRVPLYFGCQDESCAKAVNCVRINASSYEGFSDPAKRSLSTVKGGAFDLYPTCTYQYGSSTNLNYSKDTIIHFR